MTSRYTLALALAAGSALGACRRQVSPAAPEPAPVTTTSTSTTAGQPTTTTRTTTTVERKSTVNIDSVGHARADSADAANRAGTGEMLSVLRQAVFFDYDKDNLRDDAVAALDAKAAILLANPAVTVAITGHTDERGTAEYNLALGQRRAAQVKRYLASKGIADGRMTTQSLGDSQPAVEGTDEAAYQQNRRAEFEVGGAGPVLVRPQP